jgi:hypothetical protein
MKSKTTKTIEEIRASLMEVFPIVCDKPECRRSYAIEDFAHVLTLWGYIFLTNGEESFLGFTCPDCWHTTLKKYPFGSPTSVTVISEWKNGRVHYRYPDNTLTGSFVHFSAKTLSELSLISPDRIQPVTGKGKPFGIPGGFSPISSFPAIFSAEFPYAIPEESIPVLLEIENDPD